MATSRSAQAGAEVEIAGAAVSSIVESGERLAPAHGQRALDVLDRHGLPEPRRGQWYDASRFLEAVEYLGETAGPRTVSRVGMEMVDLIEWSDETSTVPGALAHLDAHYSQFHRNGSGSYELERDGDRSARVRVNTPYPAAFDRGLLKGIGYAFSGGVPRVTAIEKGGTSDGRGTQDGATRVYELTW